MALCEVNDIELSKLELIQYSHWVETEFIGLNNRILDQSANILSMDNHLNSGVTFQLMERRLQY